MKTRTAVSVIPVKMPRSIEVTKSPFVTAKLFAVETKCRLQWHTGEDGQMQQR